MASPASPGSAREASEQDIARAHKPRRADSHKGENGVVAVVGGSWIYHGAPVLAALAAMKVGVDLVYLAVPKQISAPVRSLTPNLIVFPLPDGKLTIGSANRLTTWLPRIDVAVVGPGMGRQRPEGLLKLLSELKARAAGMVLDADALRPEVLPMVSGSRCVVTPHGGEFVRLFSKEPPEDTEGRAGTVREAAIAHRLTVLLKGPVDIISDGVETIYNKTHTPAMTVGGTGDVLSGIVAGLMARGAEPLSAAVAGAFVNGSAGLAAVEQLGLHISATDVIQEIPRILKPFDRIV